MEIYQIQDYFDPNLIENGSFKFFTTTAKIELRLIQQDMSEKVIGEDQIHINVFGQSSDRRNLNWFKIELTSDIDVFFTYNKKINKQEFKQFKQEQQINVELDQFPMNFKDIINQSLTQPNEKIVFVMEMGKPKGNLVFLQDLGHKNMILLCIEMDLATQQYVQQSIMYRYSQINKKLIDSQSKLEQINGIIKSKNGDLLNTIQNNLNIQIPNENQKGSKIVKSILKKK